MQVITQNKLGPARLLVSPSWCRTKHVENASLAYAFAMDVLDGGCLIEPESPDHATVDVEGLRLRANEPTHIVPVIRRSPSGDESQLNKVSSLVASRSMDRYQPILCYVVEEERVGPDRMKLIAFRYHELDSALLPNGHKERKYRADRLIRRLTDDIELCRLIELLWLGREPVGLSSAEKSGLTNGHISTTKFHPSFLQSREASPGSDTGGDGIQGNNREAG